MGDVELGIRAVSQINAFQVGWNLPGYTHRDMRQFGLDRLVAGHVVDAVDVVAGDVEFLLDARVDFIENRRCERR